MPRVSRKLATVAARAAGAVRPARAVVRSPEAGKVDGQDVEVLGECGDDGVPGVA
jgi:hypothetical protein